MDRRLERALVTTASALATLTFALTSPAEAQVTEPNGLVVPRDSANGETQLYTLFSARGETIDYVADAAAEPSVFSPLCGFSATFVLKQSGSNLAVGWYNADPSSTVRPTVADIHVVVPAGTPVGTAISSADIRSDPAYAGGLIGFALLTPQLFFSEARLNPECTACSTPGPWTMAVVYASTTTPNAFYVAFEDGGVTSSTWSNDGDFNDYVFLFTGLRCLGGGEACDTGLEGVCASGVTQCVGSDITCRETIAAGTEACNGLDDDCDGVVDGDDLCGTDEVCDRGRCVRACLGGEFPCDAGLVCDSRGYCVEESCVDVGCEGGEVCRAGACVTPCTDVACPHGQVCRVGACVSPCEGVTCEGGEVCENGACVQPCTCAGCPGDALACAEASGLCVETSCADVVCEAGTHCLAGACVDDCEGVRCPALQICTAGACVPAPPVDAGMTSPDAAVIAGTDAGTVVAMDASTLDRDGGAGPTEPESGCGCRVGAAERGLSAGAALALAALALAFARRRRRA